MDERQHSMSCPYPEGCTCGASEYNRIVAGSANTDRILAGLLEKHDALRQSVRRLVGALNGWWSLDPDAPPHEWVRAERIAREARDALVKEHPELSALIDGKDGGR